MFYQSHNSSSWTSNGTNKLSPITLVAIGSISIICILVLPFSVFAAWKVGDEPTNLTQFVNNFNSILNPVILFVASLGFFGFLTGVLKYTNAGGDEERLGKAKQLIAYGLVGMLIMFSFWGIAKILSSTYLAVGI